MKIDEVRVYAECFEQGLDFRDYLHDIDQSLSIYNICMQKKFKNETINNCSQLLKIFKLKNFDLAISIISNDKEIPILLVEYSTAVPTDDHKMQRSDVYFWAGIFKIPVMKISPFNKNSPSKHGGGDKINTQSEIAIALNNNAIVYFVEFKYENNILVTDKDKLSCINKTKEINDILSTIIEQVKQYNDFNLVYEKLLTSFKTALHSNIESVKNIFVNSTRFTRENKDIVVKINRFGHAMDPDRGILFFTNMSFGNNHVITKFIIERSQQNGKESYKTLFDGLSKTKTTKIYALIAEGMNSQRALTIFTIATGIEIEWINIDSNHYYIHDTDFLNFLQNYTNNVYKSIFLNSRALRLCNYNNDILCEISWNPNVATEYKNSLRENTHNKPIPILPLDFKNTKEDIITFASAEIFKKIGCEILALSYPGAQADKAILVGNGRNVKRFYVDIIAAKQTNKFCVFLHESKDIQNKISEDIQKLHNIKNNYTNELNGFLSKLNKSSFDELFLGIGSKHSDIITDKIKDIDYIFTFYLDYDINHTKIFFNVGIINLTLVNFFIPLKNKDNKLQGIITLNKIYRINNE